MPQFAQTHGGGKALLYEGYQYLKIHTRGAKASAKQESLPMMPVCILPGESISTPSRPCSQSRGSYNKQNEEESQGRNYHYTSDL